MTAPSTEAAGFDIALGDIADLSEVEGRLDKYFDALPEKPE